MIKKATQCCVTKSTGYDLNVTPERGRGHSYLTREGINDVEPYSKFGGYQWRRNYLFLRFFLALMTSKLICLGVKWYRRLGNLRLILHRSQHITKAPPWAPNQIKPCTNQCYYETPQTFKKRTRLTTSEKTTTRNLVDIKYMRTTHFTKTLGLLQLHGQS